MVFCHNTCPNINNQIVLNGTIISFQSSIKTLGFTLDQNLSFIWHINSIISIVISILRRLYCIKQYLPLNEKIRLMHALIMPHFSYGPEIYGAASLGNIDRLRVVFNSAIRFTFGLKRSVHNLQPFVHRIIGTTFDRYLLFRDMVMLYKVFKHKVPVYLYSRLNFSSSPRYPYNLVVPIHTSKFMEKSFFVRIWKLWNKINFKKSNTLKCFKTEVLKFLNYCRLDEILGINRMYYR